MKCLGPSILLEPRPCLFQRIRIRGHSFLGKEAVFVIIPPAIPCLYLGTEALFVCVCPDVAFCGRSKCMNAYIPVDRTVIYEYIHSDRPLLYENQSDLPPNLFSLEKTGGSRVE
jgi:hypothetical protein